MRTQTTTTLQQQSDPIQIILNVAVCAGYCTIGPYLVLLNKHILDELNFPFPATVAVMGAIFSSAVAFLVVHSPGSPHRTKLRSMTSAEYASQVLPVGFCSATSLVL
eukprot:SAG31_NODE_28362_length_411_cov_0.826923_1_plen_106_part_01